MHVQNTARNDMAPLNERLTVVVISHNRNAYLRRTLQYYSSYPCTILVPVSYTHLTLPTTPYV